VNRDGLIVDGLLLGSVAAMFVWDAVERWHERQKHRARRLGRREALQWKEENE
jgi:hypothetical protein